MQTRRQRQRKIEPFNVQTVIGSVTRVAQWVQDEKIQIARRTITREQYRETWPDEYNSYIKKVATANLYKDPERFFRVMHNSPKLYASRFIFLPIRDTSKYLKEATLAANSIILRQAKLYGRKTGHYFNSFRVELDNQLMTNTAQLDSLDADSFVVISNIAAYASTVERNAVYYSQIGGVLYYAAKRINRMFPQLGVVFAYMNAEDARSIGSYSKYPVPYIAFGSRASVADSITRPGRRYRSRISSAIAAKRRNARLEAKARARTAAGARGEYG